MNGLLKRIPLAVHLTNFELSSVDPLNIIRRQLATLEPTLRGLLDLQKPELPLVREKLDMMEDIISRISDHRDSDLAAFWRAKMANWWVEYSKQQELTLFSGLHEVSDEDDASVADNEAIFPKSSLNAKPGNASSVNVKPRILQFIEQKKQKINNLAKKNAAAAAKLTPVEDGSTGESTEELIDSNAAPANCKLLVDAGNSKEAGLKAIQFFSKGC